jgi:DNA topoisomerase IA
MQLLIAEKEQAAERIAAYLGLEPRGLYFEGSGLYLIAAGRHLLNSTVKGLQGWNLPLFEYVWTIKKQNIERLKLIKMLKEKCEQCVIATDWDREGEVIGERIIAYCNNALNSIDVPQYRIYFSALTATEFERGFSDIKPMNESLLAQGHARNYADTIIGLNLTKLLTRIFKKDLDYNELQQALSMGRVQSPSLSYIIKESDINLIFESSVLNEDTVDYYRYLVTEIGDINVSEGFDGVDDDEVKLTGMNIAPGGWKQ